MTRALASESANVLKEIPQPYSMTENLLKGNFGDAASQFGTKLTEGASQLGTDIANAPANAVKAVKSYDYGSAIDNATKGMSDTTSGIGKVLTGSADPAAAAAVKAGTTMAPLMSTAGTIYGVMSLADQDAQMEFLKQQKAAGNIAQAEYDKAVSEINRQRDYADKVVRENPFSTNPSRDTSIGETYYGRNNAEDTLYGRGNYGSTLYAMGGSVNPPDDQTGMPNRSPMTNFDGGMLGYAAGGMAPRFLSGGGDGMSDDIPATINGKQEARLADGEFVIPADVVSHLGNGSSKAGAKQLYSMMDKVRTARTGRKAQGKQINPRKYLAA
jgi:hypothetical protein